MRGITVIIPAYQNCERALIPIQELLRQILPDEITLEIVVVDDGSTDGSAECILDPAHSQVVLHRLPCNSGRPAACNAGAERASGDVLLFMDCDCAPATSDFLAAHLDALSEGHVGSIGHVTGAGSGFWDRYQRDASSRRQRQHLRGHTFAGTSANLAVWKSAFHRIAGFDAGYRKYGFEDRDLLLRLAASGTIVWTSRATVRHLDRLTLGAVTEKMMEAAQDSASRFAESHPEAYRVLGYSRIDSRMHPWLVPIARRLGHLVRRLVRISDPLLEHPLMPYRLARSLVRCLTAISFLHGTARAARDGRIEEADLRSARSGTNGKVR